MPKNAYTGRSYDELKKQPNMDGWKPEEVAFFFSQSAPKAEKKPSDITVIFHGLKKKSYDAVLNKITDIKAAGNEDIATLAKEAAVANDLAEVTKVLKNMDPASLAIFAAGLVDASKKEM